MPAESALYPDPAARTGFLVVDTESVPDGALLAAVKYPRESLTPDEAIAKAQADAREASYTNSDFLPVTFQIPVAVCVLRVGIDGGLQNIACLDAPLFRPREIVRKFWQGVAHYHRSRLVTFNGRGFDLPLLELAAFRYGIPARDYYATNRHRFNGGGLDLQEFFTNCGAIRFPGGLNLAAKMIGRPGKSNDMAGDKVYAHHCAGELARISDYCLWDTLDTYFVFLRTRVLTGEITRDQEAALTAHATEMLRARAEEFPTLLEYLAEGVKPA